MKLYIILAEMKGGFISIIGNPYDNFQMLGYKYAQDHTDACVEFFTDPTFPIDWDDVAFIWAEELVLEDGSGNFGENRKIYPDFFRLPPS